MFHTPGNGEKTENDSSELGPWGINSDAGGELNDNRVGSKYASSDWDTVIIAELGDGACGNDIFCCCCSPLFHLCVFSLVCDVCRMFLYFFYHSVCLCVDLLNFIQYLCMLKE